MNPADFEMVEPAAAVRPFARRYLYANRRLPAPLTFRPKPTGYAYLTSFFGRSDGDYGEVDGSRFERTEQRYFFGQIVDHDVVFRHEESLEIIVCELTPTAPHRLFGVSGAEVVGLACALAEVAPREEAVARGCFRSDADAHIEAHVSEANRFFSRIADTAAPPDADVEAAVAMLESANGAVRIDDIARRLGLSVRDINRRFKKIVGVGPKLFGRILQINWVVGLLYSNDAATLTQIAHHAGFYDQAHFNHAMRRFFKEGPREFLRSEHMAFEAFLGASRRFGPSAPSA